MSDLWVPSSFSDPRPPQQRLSSMTRRLASRGDEATDRDGNPLPGHDPAMAEMRKNRRVNARTASSGRGVADAQFATMRPRDPMFYWKQNNLPYDVTKAEEFVKIRAYCRLIYMTHPVIASAIDIYSKYPLTGMELSCKDKELTDFYTTLFFDQLEYEDFLVDLGREYWTVGEAWPLGSFNETLGVWEDDELLNPDDIDVIRSPFLKEPRFQMRLPETIRKILTDRAPEWEYKRLMESYPELAHFVGDTARMPVSNILLKQLKFKGDTFNVRGVPILMRAFRPILQEEMLNAAQDAVADRLYTPLILAKLGASASDLGTQSPWIPTEDDLADFNESLDMALAADFRVLVHHFALDMSAVFGREVVPQLDADFERLTERQLQAFGLSKTMLSGAGSGETYAADALNRDLISQLLTTFQRLVRKFYEDRARVVAEAQEHYDFEMRGGKKFPVMEEVLEVDEDTGEERIVEQPKLLIPDLKIKAMNMRNEQDLRQFYEALRSTGVPVSMETRMVNVPIKLEDEIDKTFEEQIDQAVKAQEVRKETYKRLKAQNLPIPQDLKDDFEPRADNGTDTDKAVEAPVPTLGVNEPADTMGLAPTMEDYAAAPPDQEMADGMGMGNVIPLPRNQMIDPQRPPESDEMRAGMPRPAHLRHMEREGKLVDDNDEEIVEGKERLLSGPRHVGMRRHANIDKDKPLDGQETG